LGVIIKDLVYSSFTVFTLMLFSLFLWKTKEMLSRILKLKTKADL